MKYTDHANKVHNHFHLQIKQLSVEINSLIEKRMVRNDPIDDKLSLFRQQV